MGYPWLAQFNPKVDWSNACVRGPRLKIRTLGKKTGTTKIRKTTIAQQMAKAQHDELKVNTEATIPARFKRHAFIFSKEEAQ